MSINIFEFQNDITAKARSYSIPGMDSQDISQEVYLHFLKNADKYDPTKACPRTFAVRLAENKIRDLARAANAKKRYADNYSFSLEELREREFEPTITDEQ